jgi:hypothetical protein
MAVIRSRPTLNLIGAIEAMTGYCSPPIEHRFKKGQRPNPARRPRGSKLAQKRRTPFLDEKLTVRLNGKKQRLARKDILNRFAANVALQENDLELQRLLISLKEQLDKAQKHMKRDEPLVVIATLPRHPDSISCIEDAADVAGFGKKAYLKGKTGRVLLETWVVEEALERLGERRLTRAEQKIVLSAARFPKRVQWPSYWESDLRERGRGWRAKLAPQPES